VLSFGLPFALFPLVKLTASKQVMGDHLSSTQVTVLGYFLASLLTLLNLWLVASLLIGN
jgi:manganese transport protein